METDKISEKPPASDPSPTDNDVDSDDEVKKRLRPRRKVRSFSLLLLCRFDSDLFTGQGDPKQR